ncbi:hypothetical protein KBC99_00700 [Candidatus Saccharibacteria bacterium]|nr:hypothetical protein [Candidatus Saccharibacteria bacterium]
MLKNLNRDIIASFIILRNARLAGISIRSGKTAKLHCSLTLVSQLKLNL